ncbi:hypothetical protein J7384_10045 [Endozoicomonas sp. G2_1]|uniref:VolA/Pla-1 family phospholipase n=1 Tax=Endozoicomonas sp. G2_1 TaxID=2821091 RepID=UPI001AD95240|nr:VolA/Pla-1 family phospholipase [Endozoicomonas sp. G2_1]MBO9490700.1 hypothetical protein [Endozoicomonas sp. G2_1]
MKKLVLSLAVASALGLSGCDSESLQDIEQNVANGGGNPVPPIARVAFDPANGVVSVPNDVLFSGTTDGTLNIPVADPTNVADPQVALNALDGWSTINPFVLNINFPAGVALDPNSVNGASVRIFETELGGPTASSECASVPTAAACRVLSELTFGRDFVAQATPAGVAVVPLQPLKGKTSYIVTLTNSLLDDNGNPIQASVTYDLLKLDLATTPLATAAQRGLQGLVNSFETAVSSQGIDAGNIIYTASVTTQSTVDVLASVKALLANNLATQTPPVIGAQDTGLSVAQALTAQGVTLPPAQAALFSAANLLQGRITLPYYLGVPSALNPLAPVNESWKALCDSLVITSGAAAQNPAVIPANPVDLVDGQCIAISQANNLPAPGLRNLGLDTERNLTKFNPVPAPQGPSNLPTLTGDDANPGILDVQITTPDLPVVNGVRASLGLPALTAPADGWPIAILQHGITSRKEDMLAVTGLLAINGIATAAIDHPLHGSRGFNLDGQPGDELNASTVSATHYMNLASLVTTRDNLRQSTADMLGLRLGVNFMVDAQGQPLGINGRKVFFLGHSLGAITGINFTSLANTPLNDAVDPFFKVDAASFAMPGVGVANLLLESGSFSGLIKASLTLAQSAEFQALVAQLYPNGDQTEAQLVAAFETFTANLSAAQLAELNATFAQFTFAAQTVTDAGDPGNYAAGIVATQTPTHLIEVVGNGSDNLSDQVIPNVVSTSPLAGTEAAIRLLGLPSVTETVQATGEQTSVSGAVRFINGHHGSILTPAVRPEAQDAVANARATQEMQTQVAGFFASMATLIPVTDSSVIRQ